MKIKLYNNKFIKNFYFLNLFNKNSKFILNKHSNYKYNNYIFFFEKKIFFFIKEKSYIFLSYVYLGLHFNKIYTYYINNLNCLFKIFLLNNKKKINFILNKNYIYIYKKNQFYYKIPIHRIYKKKFLFKILKIKFYIVIKNKKFIEYIDFVFLKVKSNNEIIKNFNFYLIFYKKKLTIYVTDYKFVFFKTKINIYNKIQLKYNIYKLSKNSIYVYKTIFKKIYKYIYIYIYKKFIYFKYKKNIIGFKLKKIKSKKTTFFIKKIINSNFFVLKINKKKFLNKLIKIYNIINKINLINIINLTIYRLKNIIMLFFKSKLIKVKEIIKYIYFKGRSINIKINLYYLIKILININKSKITIYIKKEYLLIKYKKETYKIFIILMNIKN